MYLWLKLCKILQIKYANLLRDLIRCYENHTIISSMDDSIKKLRTAGEALQILDKSLRKCGFLLGCFDRVLLEKGILYLNNAEIKIKIREGANPVAVVKNKVFGNVTLSASDFGDILAIIVDRCKSFPDRKLLKAFDALIYDPHVILLLKSDSMELVELYEYFISAPRGFLQVFSKQFPELEVYENIRGKFSEPMLQQPPRLRLASYIELLGDQTNAVCNGCGMN